MSIRELIELGKGDYGRSEHIYATIERGKKLFKSDQLYLDEQLKAKEYKEQQLALKKTQLERQSVAKQIKKAKAELVKIKRQAKKVKTKPKSKAKAKKKKQPK